jgi:hypothetical protein
LTWSLIAFLGLWLPGPLLLSVFGFEPSIVWLVIPLCSPDGLNAVLLPARAVAVTCFAGLLGTVITPRVGLLRNDKGMAAGRVTDTPNGPGALPMHQPPRP